MGNAIDALEEAMIEIETDGSKLLSEDFMGNIFLIYIIMVHLSHSLNS